MSSLLHKAKFIFLFSRVLIIVWVVWVGVGSGVPQVLGRGATELPTPPSFVFAFFFPRKMKKKKRILPK
jgi:hypothetical protein